MTTTINTQSVQITVPDVGDFRDIPVIEILVRPGDTVDRESSLIILETDKATMEVPSTHAGIIREIQVSVGDKVSQGSVILVLETTLGTAVASTPGKTGNAEDASATPPPAEPASIPSDATIPAASAVLAAAAAPDAIPVPRGDIHAGVVVLGAGPGGYTAAFRAADLGQQVILIERYPTLGGVCLNVGCIPSKTLLHAAKVITEAHDATHHGITFGKPDVNITKLRTWKNSVIEKLTRGLTALAKQRKVQVVQGTGRFVSPHMLHVDTPTGVQTISFDHCIIAAGSHVTRIPGFPYDDPRIMDSTGALALDNVPARMLIIGGGIIGLEMATVYDALGSRISVAEWMDQLIPGADADLVKPLYQRIRKRYEAIYLGTRVTAIEPAEKGLTVTFERREKDSPAPEPQTYDRILIATGRRPNGHEIGVEQAGVQVNERGFITVDRQMRTSVPHIFGIGDIVGEPMLAHKATHEGKLAAEVIAGHKVAFDARTIPSVAYTDPEIAWMGLTETEAKKQGIDYEKAGFPWAASGRAIASGREEGITKVLLDPATRRILGAGMTGINAGELIAEAVLALEMDADMTDIGLTIHPHPTLSETLCFATEMAEGSITDLYLPKK